MEQAEPSPLCNACEPESAPSPPAVSFMENGPPQADQGHSQQARHQDRLLSHILLLPPSASERTAGPLRSISVGSIIRCGPSTRQAE